MLTSLAYLFLLGLALRGLARRLRLPPLLGMLLTGILLGPQVLNLLSGSLLSISADLRQLALIIILTQAGLSLDVGDLRKAGRSALLMCFVPASFEIVGVVVLAPLLLKVTVAEAAVMGAVLAAVSPAVVVPRMLRLMDEGYGAEHQIPQIIMAGPSADDVYVIVLFLVGATVDLRYAVSAGVAAVAVLLGALAFRMAGVLFCMLGSRLAWKERLFCMLAYLPKATVQAAIGGVPLSMGLSCGNLVLTVAVLSILITAPLGAALIDRSYQRLLTRT